MNTGSTLAVTGDHLLVADEWAGSKLAAYSASVDLGGQDVVHLDLVQDHVSGTYALTNPGNANGR